MRRLKEGTLIEQRGVATQSSMKTACLLHPASCGCCWGIQRYNFSYTCHAPQRTVPNVLRHLQGLVGKDGGQRGSLLLYPLLACLLRVFNNNSNKQ